MQLIRRYAAKGREEDARTAVRQGELTWSDFVLDDELSALVSQ